jgi:hypothetical protein
MTNRRLGILGAGVVTESITHIRELAPHSPATTLIDPAALAPHDALSQLGLSAVHQAWTMAGMKDVSSERVGLLVQSAWGTVDSTVAYLESMLEADGKYASPRHFSRSVYSSVASTAAIHFGIRGPCQTLVFAERPIGGMLQQAWRLLTADRCDRVVALWVDQGGAVAADLARRAAEQLHRREFARYAELGHGAVAVVLGREAGRVSVDLETWDEAAAMRRADERGGKRFALDAAVEFVRGWFAARTRGNEPRMHTEEHGWGKYQ